VQDAGTRKARSDGARVRNLVVPLRYEDDTTPISEAFIQQIPAVARQFLHDKQNLTVKSSATRTTPR